MIEHYMYKETPTGMYWIGARRGKWLESNFSSIEMLLNSTRPMNSAILISPQDLYVQISLGLIPEWVVDYYDPTEEDCSYYLLTIVEEQ